MSARKGWLELVSGIAAWWTGLVFVLGAEAATPTKFPIAVTSGEEMSISAAFDGTNYLVAIEEDTPMGSINPNAITAQLVSPSGTLIGSRIPVGSYGDNALVAFDGTNYLLTWGDNGNTSHQSRHGQFISPEGSLVGSAFVITSDTDDCLQGTAFGGKNYLVAYEKKVDSNNTQKMFGRIVSPAGELVGDEIEISSAYSRESTGINNVTFDGDNYLVIWKGGSNSSEVRGRFITSSGALAGDEFTVNGNTYSSDDYVFGLAVAFDGTNYLVVWCAEKGYAGSGNWDIFGQLVTPSGGLQGGVIYLSTAPGIQSLPSIAFNGINFLVTWTDIRNMANWDIYGQYVSQSGTLVGTRFPVNKDPGIQFGSAAVFSKGKFLLVWNTGTMTKDDIERLDIYGAFIGGGAINVPGDYSTIQSAIDNAPSGCKMIKVKDGTYRENINFNGKAIIVKSQNGAASTIIDGRASGSVVTFANKESHSSVLDGFTLTNGSGSTVHSNKCGGGVFCQASSPTITNCIITSNSGGGIWCWYHSSPLITGCTISRNSFNWDGGGISCRDFSSPEITGCTITGNTSGEDGGGIKCGNFCSPVIKNCVISSNLAAATGGGIRCEGQATITNCIISSNVAIDDGGGIHCPSDTTGSPKITNCTISANSAGRKGGGIRCNNRRTIVVNSILWNDTAAVSGNEISLPDAGTGAITVNYSDIQGGYAGAKNINNDPLFSGGGYQLTKGSPCIDTGTNGGAPRTDIAGNSRPFDGDGDGIRKCDMGAYEYSTCTAGIPARITCPAKNKPGASFTVSWPSVYHATSYTLQRATDSSFSDAATVYSGTKNSYKEATGLSAGTYYYRVNATTSCDTSFWRNGSAITVAP